MMTSSPPLVTVRGASVAATRSMPWHTTFSSTPSVVDMMVEPPGAPIA